MRKLRCLDAVLSAYLSVQCSSGEVISNSSETGYINTGAKCKTLPKRDISTMGAVTEPLKSDSSTMDWCTACIACWTGRWTDEGACTLHRRCLGNGCT